MHLFPRTSIVISSLKRCLKISETVRNDFNTLPKQLLYAHFRFISNVRTIVCKSIENGLGIQKKIPRSIKDTFAYEDSGCFRFILSAPPCNNASPFGEKVSGFPFCFKMSPFLVLSIELVAPSSHDVHGNRN